MANVENVMAALEIMWKGMAGIFITILIIVICIWIMAKCKRK